MSDYKISQRYAKALLEICLEDKVLDTVSNDLDFCLNSISIHRQLQLALKSPIIRKEKKVRIVDQIFKGKISDISLNFIKMVINRHRAELLEDIINAFFKLRDERLNVKNVIVQSAFELEESELNRLKNFLEGYTGKTVKIRQRIDRNLIGGFIVLIDDTVIDASVKNALQNLRKKFLAGTISLN